jgi:hypothetical protein
MLFVIKIKFLQFPFCLFFGSQFFFLQQVVRTIIAHTFINGFGRIRFPLNKRSGTVRTKILCLTLSADMFSKSQVTTDFAKYLIGFFAVVQIEIIRQEHCFFHNGNASEVVKRHGGVPVSIPCRIDVQDLFSTVSC